MHQSVLDCAILCYTCCQLSSSEIKMQSRWGSSSPVTFGIVFFVTFKCWEITWSSHCFFDEEECFHEPLNTQECTNSMMMSLRRSLFPGTGLAWTFQPQFSSTQTQSTLPHSLFSVWKENFSSIDQSSRSATRASRLVYSCPSIGQQSIAKEDIEPRKLQKQERRWRGGDGKVNWLLTSQ